MNARWVVALMTCGTAAGARAAKCELPQPKDCYDRGVEKFKANDAEAAAWFERACESGVAEGCTELGFLLMDGVLVARDDGRSLAASGKACELGSGLGCNNAFVMVRDSRGAARNDQELRRLADRSCTLGDGEGCYLSAAVHGEPLGGPLDQKRSNEALDKSCKLEFGMACSVIAHRLLEGSYGYPNDEMRGVRMMARACELESGEACGVVAAWTLRGEHGLKQDAEKALGLFQRGCELQDEVSCKSGNELRRRGGMEPAAGTLAAKLARRSSKRVLLSVEGGEVPPVGATGEVSRAVEAAGIAMDLAIAKVVVKRVDGKTIELEVVEDLSTVVLDGKKVDHWKPGEPMKLAWKRAEPAKSP